MKVRSILVLLITTLFIRHVYPQDSTLPIDASHSVVSFSIGFAGDITSIEGRFDAFEGEVGYKSQEDRSTYFANVTIDVASINTGDSQRDQDLLGEGFFNVKKYPTINFRSISTTKTSNGYVLEGELEMLGTSKTLQILFEFTHDASVAWVFGEPRIGAKARTTLSRDEFKIPKTGWDSMIPSLGSMMLNDKVEIHLVIQGVGKGLPTLIFDEINAKGVEAGLEKYMKLKKASEGAETYRFGASTLAQVSMMLNKEGKAKEGIEAAKLATQEEPRNFFGYYALALTYKSDGQYQEAIKSAERILELNPEFGRANQLLAELKDLQENK